MNAFVEEKYHLLFLKRHGYDNITNVPLDLTTITFLSEHLFSQSVHLSLHLNLLIRMYFWHWTCTWKETNTTLIWRRAQTYQNFYGRKIMTPIMMGRVLTVHGVFKSIVLARLRLTGCCRVKTRLQT